jgi:outer membrane protein assembly factor BamB
VKLLDDLAQARQVWISETKDLGYAKGSASGYVQNLARWDGHPGSSSGPILAEGKLFVTTFRPSGDAWAEGLPHLRNLDASGKPFSDVETTRMRGNLRILADDLLVAIDAQTGKTAWTAVEAGQGLNRYMGKRQGFCVSPAYHDGVVYSLGTTGRLYAYVAADGRKLWETDIGPTHAAALEHKAKVLAQKTLPGGMGWDVSLVVADGVLVVPLCDGVDVGLRGVELKSGKTLWEVAKACSRHATPAIWSHEGKQYVLTATVSGLLRLIEPTSGRVLWTVDGLGPNHFSLTPTQRHVFVNCGSARLQKEGDDERYGRLAAYALGPDKATLAWQHPDQPDLLFSTWMDSCARRFLAVQGDRVFYRAHGVDKSEGQLLALDESTGNVISRMTINSPALHFYPVGDRLLTIRDSSHSETELAFLRPDGDKITQLADFWHPPHQNTTAYEVCMEHPFADGLFYLRTKDGRVACYDLRVPQ